MAATSGLLHAADVEAASAPSSSTVTTVPLTTTSLEPVVVTETRDIYDTIVVPTSAAPAPAPAPEPAPAPAAPLPVSSGSAPPPATAPPATTTTTERPDGVPEDWPEDQPIPPMPPGCEKPQLEDNGEWNCDH